MTGVVSPAGREASPAPRALRAVREIPAEQQARWLTAAERLGVTWPDLVLAALGGYVARLTGREDTRLGVPFMNRLRAGQGVLPAAGTVCTAMNVLPVTVPVSGSVIESTRAAVNDHAAVRAHSLERQEDLARTLRVRGDQLFGVQVNLVPFGLTLRIDGAVGSVRNLTAGPVEDMTVCLRGTPGRRRTVRLEIDANPELYDQSDVDGHLDRIATWLDTWAGSGPDTAVVDLPLPTPEEFDTVVRRFNATHVERDPATLGRRFLDQVARTPEAIAVIDGEHQRSYAELARAARSLAAGLRSRGVQPGAVVGVALPRSMALIEVVHAIALAGAVYLPLDPDLPPARIDAMVEDAGAALVITTASLPELAAHDPHPSDMPDDLDSPAYVLFTSGSTGRPKGVQVGQRAIDNRLAWMQHQLPLGLGDRVLHKTPISFDVSVWELFWPTQTGATLVIAPPGAHRDPRAIAELVSRHEVAVLHFVPSMLRAFLADRVAVAATGHSVRHVVTSGEALTPVLVTECAEAFGVAPTNLYGPTEAAIDVTWWDCAPGDTAVPIGRPVWNTACFVLDGRLRPQPVGVPGELWLSGVQLADGYLGRPDLTAERFVPAPAELRRHGDTMYRTGDLACWRPDGALQYLGRVDDQVKVRGQRIELGEIEAALSGVVQACAATLVDDLLVVWFVTPDDRITPEALRDHAAAVLPTSVLPHHWIRVDALPLTTSGKVDRGSLARSWRPPAATAEDSPSGLLEERVCAAFAEVLSLPSVGPTQDFFALGGDSLRVLRLIGRLEDDLGTELRLADVFAAPTPGHLAHLIGDGAGTDTGEVLTLRAGDPAVAPLFLLPPAGGLGWCYASLLRSLPPAVGVHTIQAPGLEDGQPEPAADLAALAKRQLAAIRDVVGDGAFHVAGWSLGGMAAHAVAAQARTEGQPVGAVVLLDAYPADQWRHLPEPTEAEALRGVLRLGGLDPDEHDRLDRETAVRLLRESGSAVGHLPDLTLSGCLASVVEAARITRTSEHQVFDGDVTIVVATAPRPEDWLSAEAWRPYVGGELRVVPLESTHGELVRAPVVDDVGALISRLVAPGA